MALLAESLDANLLKSLNAFFFAQLVTGAGVQVHFPDRPGLFTPTSARWVRIDYLLGMQRTYMGTVATTARGNLARGIVNLNCCELVASRTDPYALAALRDIVRAVMPEGASIPVRDYTTGGIPIVGYLVVCAITEAMVASGLGSTENGVAVRNVSAEVEYIEGLT